MKALKDHCSGHKVTYNPTDESPLSQAIKAVSIPADRKIPHFDDLYHQLKDAFPDADISEDPTKGAIIIRAGEKSIRLEKRHKLGGKVTISFGEEVKGGMWNDKVEAVISAFLESTDYPNLKAESVSTERVIQETPSSSTVVRNTISALKESGYEVGGSELLGGRSLNLRGYQITKDGVTLYVRRVKTGDSRFFNVYSDRECSKILRDVPAPLSATDLRDRIPLGFEKEEQYLKNAKRLVVRSFNGFSRCCDRGKEGYDSEYTNNGYNPRHVIMTKVGIELGVLKDLNVHDENAIKVYLQSENFNLEALYNSLAKHLVGNEDAIKKYDNLLLQYAHSEES